MIREDLGMASSYTFTYPLARRTIMAGLEIRLEIQNFRYSVIRSSLCESLSTRSSARNFKLDVELECGTHRSSLEEYTRTG